MIDTKRLRQKILDLAIRGKLVSQDPADEPASVLLERIHAEKLQMVADGKLKKKDVANDSVIYLGDDNLHYEKVGDSEPVCIEEELPFQLPDGWRWSRIGTVFLLAAGKNVPADSISPDRLNGLYPCYGGNGLRGYITKMNRTGDFPIIGRQGALCGNINYAGGSFYATEHAITVERFQNTSLTWSLQLLTALNLNQYATSTAQPGLAVKVINNLLIPVPPIAEQDRIALLLDDLLARVDTIEHEQAELDKLLAKTRSKVLDLAIRGKLVPQDPADEPASVLLERIHAEKLQMVADGKLKKKDVAGDSVIYRGDDNSYYEKVGNSEPICVDDELPFDIPRGWAWVRMSTVFTVNPRNDSPDDITASFVPMNAIEPGFTGMIHPEQRSWKTIKQGYTHFANGDIVFSKISPCFENGKYFIASGLTNGIGSGTTELFVLRPINDSLERQYVLTFLSSRTFVHGATETFMGTVGQQRVKREYVESSLLPVPSEQEQLRICKASLAVLRVLCFK